MDHFLRADLRFRVVDSGPSDGPVAVLLHGFPQQPACYRPVADRLNAVGVRTLVPQMRGYAPAARPTQRREYRTEALVDDVLALLDADGVEQAHLVGHDWGAAPVWGMASWHPDRTASITVLSTPHPSAMLKAFRTSNQALKSWYMAFFQLPRLPEVVVRPTLGRTLRQSGLPDDHIRQYVANAAEPGALTAALNWYRGLPFSPPSGGPHHRADHLHLGTERLCSEPNSGRTGRRLRRRALPVRRSRRRSLAAGNGTGCRRRRDRLARGSLI